MPQRSQIETVSEEIRAQIDNILIAAGFSRYKELEDEVRDQLGLEISKSALQRRGSKVQRRLQAVRDATEAAKSIAEAAPDDGDDRSAATMSLVQTDIFNIMVDLQDSDEVVKPEDQLKLRAKAAKAIAELSRASVNQKKWRAQVQFKALQEAAKRFETAALSSGMEKDQAEFWRKKFLGVPD